MNAALMEWVYLFAWLGGCVGAWMLRGYFDGRPKRPPLLSGGFRQHPSIPSATAPLVRRYADVERDHREHGDEDPPRYRAGDVPARANLSLPAAAVEKWVRWYERRARHAGFASVERDLGGLWGLIARARREGRVSLEEADDLVDQAYARVRAAARAEPARGRIERRKPGIVRPGSIGRPAQGCVRRRAAPALTRGASGRPHGPEVARTTWRVSADGEAHDHT